MYLQSPRQCDMVTIDDKGQMIIAKMKEHKQGKWHYYYYSLHVHAHNVDYNKLYKMTQTQKNQKKVCTCTYYTCACIHTCTI